MTQAHCPFCQGYEDAKAGTVYDPTSREVEAAYPKYSWPTDVQTYINGVLDAMDDDDWRMRSHLAQEAK